MDCLCHAQPRGAGAKDREAGEETLARDDFSSNRHLALTYSWSMIFFRKPVSTFRDHALTRCRSCDATSSAEHDRDADQRATEGDHRQTHGRRAIARVAAQN